MTEYVLKYYYTAGIIFSIKTQNTKKISHAREGDCSIIYKQFHKCVIRESACI